MILRAFLSGLLGLLVTPVVVFFGVLGLAHAAGGCGPGDAGGCEMGAASLAILSILPGFVLFALVSLARDLLRKR